MRLAYLISWRGGRLTGPFKKMADQSRVWSDLGHDVALFVTTSEDSQADWLDLGHTGHIEPAARGALPGILARRRVYRALETWKPDVIYLRHGIYTPGLGRLLRRFPTVLEINGDEVAVARHTSGVKAWWAQATRSIVLSRARGAVSVSHEWASDARLGPHPAERIVIPNGIDLAATPSLPPTSSTSPTLALLGHPRSPWHGTDKLVELARRHPDWTFDVIGPDGRDLDAAPPANLTMHSELTTDEYVPVLARADVGIGSLAMHRVGSEENPALKVREYLALGLAVIVGCRDPDFPDPVDYLLALPNTPSNVDDHDEQIERFVHAWHGRRVARQEIAHLDLRAKEELRLRFIASCTSTSPARELTP
jgi:hypothetical protein